MAAREGEALRFERITDEARLRAVAESWAALWARTPEARFGQHPDWCAAAWDLIQSRSGRQLLILAVWRGPALVGVLPLTGRQRFGVASMALLGPGGTGFTIALIAPEEDARALTDAMLDHLASGGLGAILRLQFVREDTVFGATVLARRNAVVQYSEPTSLVRWEAASSWNDYLASRTSKSLLSNYRRLRRRLEELGDVRFEEVIDPAQRAATVDWLFRRKIEWLDRTGREQNILNEDPYQQFVQRLAARPRGHHGLRIYRTTLGGEILAAQTVIVGVGVFEIQIITHAKAYEKYSIGRLLMEDVVKAAYDEGLVVDLRVGEEAWKANWRNETSRALSVEISEGVVGRLLPLYRKAYRLAQRLRSTYAA